MLGVCKIATFMIFFNLYCYVSMTGSYIPNGTTIFGFVAVGSMAIDVLTNKKVSINRLVNNEIKLWVLFAVAAAVTAPFVAQNLSTTLRYIIQYGEKLVFIIVILYICMRDNSIEYPLKMMIVVSTIAAILVVMTGGDLSERAALTDNANPNKTGNMMLFGMACLLYFFNCVSIPKQMASTVLMLLFLLVIFLSGSRKSLYGVILLAVIWMLFNLRSASHTFPPKRIFIYVFFLAVVVFTYIYLLPMFEQTAMFERLFGRRSIRAEESNAGRIKLYLSAINDWLTSPVLGKGFMGYFVQHGSYTHSTYAEVLVNCGMIGMFLYFAPYVQIGKKLKKKLATPDDNAFARRNNRWVIALALVYLFIGLGVGQMYDNVSSVELGVILGYAYIDEHSGVITKRKRLKFA